MRSGGLPFKRAARLPKDLEIFSPRRSETLALGQVARLLDCFIAAVFPFTAGNDLQNAIR